MFARFYENPAMTLRVSKETKRYGRTDGRTDNVKTVYPLQTKFAGGITIDLSVRILLQKCWTEIMEKLALENKYTIVVSLFGAAHAAPNKDTAILYRFNSLSTVLSPT